MSIRSRLDSVSSAGSLPTSSARDRLPRALPWPRVASAPSPSALAAAWARTWRGWRCASCLRRRCGCLSSRRTRGTSSAPAMRAVERDVAGRTSTRRMTCLCPTGTAWSYASRKEAVEPAWRRAHGGSTPCKSTVACVDQRVIFKLEQLSYSELTPTSQLLIPCSLFISLACVLTCPKQVL